MKNKKWRNIRNNIFKANWKYLEEQHIELGQGELQHDAFWNHTNFLTFGFFILVWLGVITIRYLRKTRHNTELWGTIFEGVTHKLINLDPQKQPEIFIEKKARRSGKGVDEIEEKTHP